MKSLEDLKNWSLNDRRQELLDSSLKYFFVVIMVVYTEVKMWKQKKINCRFKVKRKYLKAHDGWKLKIVCDDQNHKPSMYMEDKETRLVQDLTELNVKSLDILSTIKPQNENNVCSLKTIYSCRHKFTISQCEGRTLIQNVMHILHTRCATGGIVGVRNRIDQVLERWPGVPQSNAWSWRAKCAIGKVAPYLIPIGFRSTGSADAQQMWQTFPYVVLMDATYKKNKYNLPFLEIIGVTSTRMMFFIAAFMHSEKTSNYRWALIFLNLTINDSFSHCVIVTNRDLTLMKACKDVFPQSNNGSFCHRVIVTDRDLTLMKACKDVFPQSNHLLCRWHIFNDITKHCRRHIKLEKTWGSLHPMWKKLVESPTLSAYMQAYADLPSLLSKDPAEKTLRHSSSLFDLNDELTRHSSSFFDLNDELTRHSSPFFNLNDEPARHSSFFMGMHKEAICQFLYQFDSNEEPIG
uniref:MULE transposase domain-containing protein n=1 Tax=Lactuca sativa TaxID=4236 RepID=A0A9R1UEE4_LACSA|nr:hypothetical protein LSAT_V11C900495140 [Lactuca sativa]